jgi:hypothetical protein
MSKNTPEYAAWMIFGAIAVVSAVRTVTAKNRTGAAVRGSKADDGTLLTLGVVGGLAGIGAGMARFRA